MKYAITGHTGFVGSYLNQHLDNCIGFSRSNGFDLREQQVQDRILELSQDCDVFVNCAHAGPGNTQTAILWNFFYAWQDKNKYIINIGSDHATPKVWSLVRSEYSLEKSILAMTVDNIQKQHKSLCKVSIINPNVVKHESLPDILNAIRFITTSKTQINSINLQ